MASALLVLSVTMPTAAPAADGMQCFRIKDSVRLKGVVDINTADFGLAAGCKIGRARQYCVPASSTSQSITSGGVPIDPLPVFGPEVGAQICYKVRCPKAPDAVQEVSDRFAHRNVRRMKPQTLCVPAVAGPPETPPVGMCTVPENAPAPSEFIPVCYPGGGPATGTIRGNYEPGAPVLRIFGSNEAPLGVPAGTAQNTVHVAKQETVALVLSAYSRTEWIVTADPGALIERIVVVGYEQQFVTAPAGVPVSNFSPYEVAMAAGFEVPGGGDVVLPDDWPSNEADAFISSAEAYTGLCLTSYHYCYGGGSMVVPQY